MTIPKNCKEVHIGWLDGSMINWTLSNPNKIDEFEDCYEFMSSYTNTSIAPLEEESSMIVVYKSQLRFVRFVESK